MNEPRKPYLHCPRHGWGRAQWLLFLVLLSGLFRTLLDPKRLATLLDRNGPPYRWTASFDVPRESKEFVLGIKREAYD
jgi:hypothetical protein